MNMEFGFNVLLVCDWFPGGRRSILNTLLSDWPIQFTFMRLPATKRTSATKSLDNQKTYRYPVRNGHWLRSQLAAENSGSDWSVAIRLVQLKFDQPIFIKQCPIFRSYIIATSSQNKRGTKNNQRPSVKFGYKTIWNTGKPMNATSFIVLNHHMGDLVNFNPTI